MLLRHKSVTLLPSLPSAPYLCHDKDKKAIYRPALAMLNNSGGVQLLLRPRNSGFHLSVTFKTCSPPSASITITAGEPCLTHTPGRGRGGIGGGHIRKAGRRKLARPLALLPLWSELLLKSFPRVVCARVCARVGSIVGSGRGGRKETKGRGS